MIMLFVLVAFFETLHLTIITEPLNRLLNQLFDYAPRLLSAGILALVAWVLATVLKKVIVQLAASAHLDERLSRSSGESVSIGQTLLLSKPPGCWALGCSRH